MLRVLIFISLFLFIFGQNKQKVVQEVLGKKLPSEVLDVIDARCMNCHDAETKKGNIDLEPLFKKVNEGSRHLWQRSLEMVNDKLMPPKPKKKKKKPNLMTKKERRKVTLALDSSIIDYYANYRKINGSLGKLRRIANYEIIQFAKEFGVDKDLVANFLPDERSEDGFENNSEHLRVSEVHLESYRKVALAMGNYIKKFAVASKVVGEKNFTATKEQIRASHKHWRGHYQGMLKARKKTDKNDKKNGSKYTNLVKYCFKNYKITSPQWSKADGTYLLGGSNNYPIGAWKYWPVYTCHLETAIHISVEGYYKITIKARADKHYSKGDPMILYVGRRNDAFHPYEYNAIKYWMKETYLKIPIFNKELKEFSFLVKAKPGQFVLQSKLKNTGDYNAFVGGRDKAIAIASIKVEGPMPPAKIAPIFAGLNFK